MKRKTSRLSVNKAAPAFCKPNIYSIGPRLLSEKVLSGVTLCFKKDIKLQMEKKGDRQ